MGFHHVGQAGLELLTASDPLASTSQGVGLQLYLPGTSEFFNTVSLLFWLCSKDLELLVERHLMQDFLSLACTHIHTHTKNKHIPVNVP
ncbi:hypothetical protein AAY473_034860 [Plecturocebus cupreus]